MYRIVLYSLQSVGDLLSKGLRQRKSISRDLTESLHMYLYSQTIPVYHDDRLSGNNTL